MTRPLILHRNLVADCTAAELLDPQPKVVATWAAAPFSIDIDLQAAQAINCIWLGYTNASQTATWRIDGGVSGYADTLISPQTPIHASGVPGARPHALWIGADVVVSRLRLSINPGGQSFSAGALMAGLTFAPAWPRDESGGFQPVDTSVKQRGPDGALHIDRRVVLSTFEFSFADLYDDELNALDTMAREAGLSSPVLAIDDPNRDTAMIYGVFSKIDRAERRTSGLHRWSAEIEEWL